MDIGLQKSIAYYDEHRAAKRHIIWCPECDADCTGNRTGTPYSDDGGDNWYTPYACVECGHVFDKPSVEADFDRER